jgi:hypothetical protein
MSAGCVMCGDCRYIEFRPRRSVLCTLAISMATERMPGLELVGALGWPGMGRRVKGVSAHGFADILERWEGLLVGCGVMKRFFMHVFARGLLEYLVLGCGLVVFAWGEGGIRTFLFIHAPRMRPYI